ncbi:MAG: glycosyl transferase [Paludibacteraceae bacterium]|nr:glycosyl transferase [Paludibacteraceae bacterium]
MIPKTIHYCWFGRGQMPELAIRCIESWHKYMPDWQYKLWNEDNFDVNALPYTKEAYEAKKFAFVSDVARLKALYDEGGVYMDTDVEIIKPLDDLASLTAYTGYEGSKHHPPVTGIMASCKQGEWVKEQLDYYSPNLHFIKPDGSLDLTSNTQTISRIMHKNGFVSNGGKKQTYKDLTIFPVEYFCPKQTTGEFFLTANTYCNHHFCGSWSDNRKTFKSFILSIIPSTSLIKLIKLKRKIFG